MEVLRLSSGTGISYTVFLKWFNRVWAGLGILATWTSNRGMRKFETKFLFAFKSTNVVGSETQRSPWNTSVGMCKNVVYAQLSLKNTIFNWTTILSSNYNARPPYISWYYVDVSVKTTNKNWNTVDLKFGHIFLIFNQLVKKYSECDSTCKYISVIHSHCILQNNTFSWIEN